MIFAQSQKKAGYLLISILFLVPLLVYLPTLFNGFVYDDMEQVLANPWIVDFAHLGDIFFSATWAFMKESGGSNYYRPMMHLGFLIEQHLFGFSPKAFHLLNILMHSLNSVLLFFIAIKLIASWSLRGKEFVNNEQLDGAFITSHYYMAFSAAMIFALHPINSEVVNWVSALPELTYTLFLFLAFYIYITFNHGARKAALTSLLFFLALLSKETAMSFVLIILCYDFSILGHSFIKRYRRYIPYIITAVIYMGLRTYALGGFAQSSMVESTLYGSIINIFPTTLRYIVKLVWPSNLSIIYSYKPFYSLADPFVILSILVLLSIAVAAFAFRKRGGVVFLSLWIIIPLLPVLYAPVVSIGGFADRYLYLPSAGFAILAVVLFSSLSSIKETGKIFSVLLILLLIIYSVLTVKRSMAWKDSMTLWASTVESAPNSLIVNMGLAAAYRSEGDNEKAIEFYNRALRIDPFTYKPYYNLALIYSDINDTSSAEANYLTTIRLNPLNDRAYFNLAVLYDKSGEFEKAAHYYKETIRVNPLSARARDNLAQLYKNSNNPVAALREYKEAVLANPLSSTAHYNLAWSLQEAGDNKSAIESFKEAVSLDRENAKAIYGLAWIYHFIGDIVQAERFYNETVIVDPLMADAHFNLGLIYSNSGDFPSAAMSFKRVVEINPQYREAKERLERAQNRIKR